MAVRLMQAIRVMAAAGLIGMAVPSSEVLAKPQAAAARPARQTAGKPLSLSVKKVIELHQAQVSEERIIRTIAKEQLQTELTSDDLLALSKAGVSERVISALEGAASTSDKPEPVAVAPRTERAPALEAAPSTAPTAVATPLAAPAPAPVVTPASARPAAMRRAYIEEFKWEAVRTYADQMFGTTEGIGQGIRTLLTTRLQKQSALRLVERAQLGAVTEEIDRTKGAGFQQGSGPVRGQLKGADVILMGSITTFGRDDKSGGVAGVINRVVGAGVLSTEGKAVVVIDYHFVDAATGDIIGGGEARGESSRKGKLFALGAGNWRNGGGVAAGMASSNFRETIIGEAVMDACDKLANAMIESIPTLPISQRTVEARVASVTGSSMTITAGTNESVQAQEIFEIFRILKEVKDPVTGEILDNEVQLLGTMTVASVRERIATGTYTGMPIRDKEITDAKILARRLQ